MILDRIISHLRNSGVTVYKAGNNSDIERKPCVVIGMAGYTQPWAPLPAREYTLSMILINNRSDSELERTLVRRYSGWIVVNSVIFSILRIIRLRWMMMTG